MAPIYIRVRYPVDASTTKCKLESKYVFKSDLDALEVYLVEGEQAGKGLAAVLKLQQGCAGTLLLQRALPGLVKGQHGVGMAGPLLHHLLEQRLVPDMQAASTQPCTTTQQRHAALAQQGSLPSPSTCLGLMHSSTAFCCHSSSHCIFLKIGFAGVRSAGLCKTLPTDSSLGTQ